MQGKHAWQFKLVDDVRNAETVLFGASVRPFNMPMSALLLRCSTGELVANGAKVGKMVSGWQPLGVVCVMAVVASAAGC